MLNKNKVKNSKAKLKSSSKSRRHLYMAGFVTVFVVGVASYAYVRSNQRSSMAESVESGVRTADVLTGGSVTTASSSTALAKSPIKVKACRMSDKPGNGKENRVYVGAVPIISVETADKMNAFWNRHFSDYRIKGEDVATAADYTMPASVYFEASYIVEKDNPTKSTGGYDNLLKPSEAIPQIRSGKYDSNSRYDSGKLSTNPNGTSLPRIKREYIPATIYDYRAYYAEKDYAANSRPSPFPDGNGRGGSGGNSGSTNDLAILPGKLPGKTTWSYIQGPVALYNDARCKASQNSRDPYGCQNNPTMYDTINNPNPFIKIDVSWANGRLISGLDDAQGGTGKPFVEKIQKVVRFSELPRCGSVPGTYKKTLSERQAEAAKFNRIIAEQEVKAAQEIQANGIDITKAQERSTNVKIRDIQLKHGISPIANRQVSIWTGLPAGAGNRKNPVYNQYYWELFEY